MRVQEAAAFEREYYSDSKGRTKVRTVLKPKRNRFIGGGQGSNIRPVIPAGVTITTITPRDNPTAWAKHEAAEAWKAKRTWIVGQGWTLLEDDSEDDYDNGLDPARTHILGGVVDHGTHTTGVCSDECWCKEGEEE